MPLQQAWARLRTNVQYALRRRKVRRNIYLGIGLVLLAGAAWVIITALIARSQVRALHDDLFRIRALISAGQLDDARKLAAELPAETARVERLTSGPAWWVAAHVPYFGDPAATVRGMADGLDTIGKDAVPQLVDVIAKIDPAKLRTSGNTVDLARLRAATPELQRAAKAFDGAVDRIRRLSYKTWLTTVDNYSSSVANQLTLVRGYVDAANRAAAVLPDMLGGQRPMRYLVGLQNEAEMRGTGGLPGAFAVAVASHGTVRFERFFSDTEFMPAKTQHRIDTGLDFGNGYGVAYGGQESTELIAESNLSPNFPYTAQIWARMYEKTFHEHIDGVLAMDPTVLQYLLQATGPVTTPEGLTVSGANVVSLTQREEYALFRTNAARKAFLVNVLKRTSTKVTSGAGRATALAQAFVQATKERRFLVWSELPTAQHALEQTTYAGTFGPPDQPLAAPILNNAAAGKLDYYLYRTMTYRSTGCGATRDVNVTVTLTNKAPAAGLPPYVTDRLDVDKPANVKPGDNRTLLDYYATAGAQLQSVDLNGKPTQANVQHDLGRPIFRVDIELPRGTTQTLTLHLTEPAGKGPLEVWNQPGVNPMPVAVYQQSC